MIVGHGDIAKALLDHPNRTYFASGVSNSQERRISEFQREKDLLLKQPRNRRLIYFSSLSIFHPKTKFSNEIYIRHKMEMEDLIKKTFPQYTIVRLGNITWGTNTHTLINALKDKILHNEPFEIIDAYRYVVSHKEFRHWMNMIPDWNCEMNVPGRMMKIKQIVKKYVLKKVRTSNT